MQSKRKELFIILGVGIVLIIIFLITFLLRGSQKNISIPFSSSLPTIEVNSITPSVNATSLLSFKQLSSNSIVVNVDSGKKAISAVQLEISYDPLVLNNITVSNGTFFDNPFVLINKVDPNTKSIFYAVGVNSNGQPKIGKGTIAVISFAANLGVANQTSLQFLPKTKVTAEGVDVSVLKESTGITIDIK